MSAREHYTSLFVTLRRRIQDSIDRRFYRRKYNSTKTLATFAKAVRTEVDLYQLTRHLLGLIEDTLQLAQVSLWLRDLPDRATSPRPAVQRQSEYLIAYRLNIDSEVHWWHSLASLRALAPLR